MNRDVRQTAHTILVTGVRLAIAGLTTIVVARALGPEGRGQYAVLITVAAVTAVLGNLSIEPSHTSLWSRTRKDVAIASNSLLFGLVVGMLSAGAAAVVVAVLNPTVLPVPSWGLLVVALGAVPCTMLSQQLGNVLVLRGRIEVVNWSGLVAVSVHCAALLLAAAAGHLTLGSVVVAWTMCAAVPLAVLVPSVRPRFRDRDLALACRALGMGLRYHIGNTSLYLLLRADVLVLNALAQTRAVGLYSVAVTLVELARVAADSVAQVVLRRQMAGEDGSAAGLTAITTRYNTLLTLGSAGLLCAAAPVLIPVVYGPAFGGSVAPLYALAPGLIALGAGRTIGAYLLRLHRPLRMSAIAFAAMTINVLLNLALIPVWGVMGCAVASSLSYCALVAMNVVWFLGVTGMPPRCLIPGRDEVRYVRAAWSRVVGTARPG